MNDIKTFSYDARVVKLNSIFMGLTLPVRKGCNGFIPVIYYDEFNRNTHIYVTNINEFTEDKTEYGKSKNPLRGTQFDVIKYNGVIFTSYTYVKDSFRAGGISDYAMK